MAKTPNETAVAAKAPRKAAPKRKPAATAPEPDTPAPAPAPSRAPRAAKAAAPAEAVVELRKKALVERVASATGAKKKVVRGVLEAAFAEIGEALSRGEGLNLPPLGKARVNRQKEKGAGEILVLKLRRTGPEDEAEEGLADAAQ